MKKIIRYFLVGMLGLALLGGAILHAVPAPQVPRKVVLPDGSSITLIVHGDEYVSWLTTTDGYSVKKNQAGYFEYVREVKDGQCVLSGVRAYDPSVRPQKEKRFLKKIQPNLKEPVSSASRSGMRKGVKASEAEWLKSPQDFASKPDFKGVLVPVNFSDYPLVTSEKTIDSLMNFAGYTTSWGLPGSVRDYFYDMSQGQFEFSIDVLPAYTALQCRECYGKEAPTLKEEVESYVLEVLGERAADYDRNKDGYIDHISIIFAGQGQESTGTEGMIWSHSYSEWYNGGSGWAKSRACIAEIDNLYDSRPGIETYCHEFGHVLGLPDHYDSKYTYWTWEHPAEADLMSANTGRGIPVPMSAFSRFCLGWTRFKTLSAATAGTFRLQDMLQEYHALRYNTTTPGEFFVLENRTPLNKWQSYPENGSGMLIFRVDSAGYRSRLADNTVNAGSDHMCFELLRADNSSNYYDKESDFFPYNGTYTSFTDNTTPSSKSLAGKNTNLPITNIRQENNIISFNFVSQGNRMLAVSGDITPDTLWGVYKAIGEVIQSNGNLCAQKGFCYGLLPTPTVSGNKVEATGEDDAFCVSLDLRSFVPGAVINVRAYATDQAGNTVYGAKQQITLPKVPVKVSDYYVARKKDNDFIPNMFKEYQGIELDLSEMTSPMVEVYYNENPWSSTAMNILVSSDNGRNYQEAAPTKIVHQNKVNTHIYSYSLPAPSKHYRIILTIYNVDSLIVKEGIPYQLTPTPTTKTNVSPVSENAYRANDSWGRECESLPSTILSVNTSHMTKPVLHWRGPNDYYEITKDILFKTASQRLYSNPEAQNNIRLDCGITFKKTLKKSSNPGVSPMAVFEDEDITINPPAGEVNNNTPVTITYSGELNDVVIYFMTLPDLEVWDEISENYDLRDIMDIYDEGEDIPLINDEHPILIVMPYSASLGADGIYTYTYAIKGSVPENEKEEYMDLHILSDYTLALPQDTLVHILLAHNGYTVEVLDFEDQSLSLRRLQAIDNTTVEIEGLRLPQDNLPILDQEYGICWNTVPTPTLSNRKALSGNEYNFVCPLTGLPEATLYFYTYAKNGQNVYFSSRYLVSQFANGKRADLLPFDSLNTVVPIGKTAETYTVRARYLSSQLEQSTTQGICHNEYSGNGLPDINSSIQYNENNLGTVNYYNIETKDHNLRTFVMDSKGAVSYGPLAEISACTNEQEHPYRPGKILKAPCDLIEDAAQYANDYRIKGTDYWKKPLIKNNYGYSSGMDASSNYIRFQYSKTSDSTFISPIIDQSALSLPILFLSIEASRSESPNAPKTFSVWGINVRTGEKTLLRYIEREKYENLGGDYNDEGGYYPYGERLQKVAIPLKAAGDSIYLAFEFPRCPYGTASITIREMRIEDQVTPEVHTLRISVDDKHEVSMNGQIEDLGQPDPVLRSGFVYSIYGDPLQDGSVAPLAESVEVNADSEGKFSFSFVQKMAAYVYCRAFATNAHGTSYGDLNSVAVCGEYLVTADDLPVTDNFRAPAFTASGQETSFSCNNGSYTFISGILDLKNRPTTHRIKVSADDINVHIPHTVADEYGLPYNAAYYSEWAEPFVQLFRSTTFLYYRTENDPEWKIMPEEAFTMNFGGGITYLNGDFISAFFSFEFHGPNDLSQIKMVSEDTRWTLLYFPSITYEVSERSDLTAVAPQIDYVTVEDKHNTLQWHIDDWNNVEKIVFYREGNTFGSLEALQEISYTPSAPLTGVFTDLSSVPSRKAYTYTVKSFNSEGWEYASTPHKTMHLTISKGIGTQWNLQWNPYEGRQVSSVSIYRGNSEGSLEFIDEIAGTNNSYTDVDAPEGDVFYVVEVAFTEPVAARKSQGAVSRSNVATNTVQEENYYTLTLGESYNGRVAAYYNGQNVPSGSMLEEGSLLTLTAIPDNGYQFESWMDGNTANPRDIMLNGDLYVSAIFTERQGNYNYYTVNITQTTFGWVSVSCNGQNIPSGSVLEEGSLLTLTAMPDSNCLFANWMDGDMSNPRTLVLSQDLHVSAAFIRQQQGNSYTVNIVQTAHGQVTVSCNGQNVPSGSVLEEGSLLTLTATPDNGYQFDCWMNGVVNNPYSINLFQNENISATFKKKETPSGNEDGDKGNAISVYPNPVSDVLYVSSPFVIVHAELRDLQGKVVYRRENFTETSIDMKNLPAGVYLLLCRNAQETYRSKVIKRQ